MKLGNYELLSEIAAGGMATVHVARHEGAAGFERLVVIKRVHRHLAIDPEFREMFRNEALVSAAIRHANVVPVIDVVENGGELFLVLEYVESVSLSQLIRAARERSERLPPRVVVRILSDALSGLHAAHEATDLRGARLNLVHRDVSPQNMIVGRDGTTRLIDFGIAKAAALVSYTKSGEVKGKLAYFSPEQVRRHEVDRRADVFAAGVVLYEALSGKRLFSGEDEGDILLAILAAEVPDLPAEDPRIPRAIGDVLEKALARDRDERFQTAEAFRDALVAALAPATDKEAREIVMDYFGEKLSERRMEILSHVRGESDSARGMSTPVSVEDRTLVDPLAPAAHLASLTEDAAPKRRRATSLLVPIAVVVVGLLFLGQYLWRRTTRADGEPRLAASTVPAEIAAVPATGAVPLVPLSSSAPTPSAAATSVPASSFAKTKAVAPRGKGKDLHASPYR